MEPKYLYLTRHIDWPTFARMIGFFSVPGKYVHLPEIKEFYDSMGKEEWTDFKVDFWSYMVTSGQDAASVI